MKNSEKKNMDIREFCQTLQKYRHKETIPFIAKHVIHDNTTIEIGKVLGKGSFGCVFHVHIPNHSFTTHSGQPILIHDFAMKISLLSPDDPGNTFDMEQDFMEHLEYPYLVHAYGKYSNTMLIMDYYPPLDKISTSAKPITDLYGIHQCSLKKKMTFSKHKSTLYQIGAMMFLQLSGALYYLHHHMIINNDIKPENVLIDREGRLILADYGLLSCFIDSPDQKHPLLPLSSEKYCTMSECSSTQMTTRTSSGSMFYSSPSKILEKCQNYRSDLWSLFVLVSEFIYNLDFIDNDLYDKQSIKEQYRTYGYDIFHVNLEKKYPFLGEDHIYKAIKRTMLYLMENENVISDMVDVYLTSASVFSDYLHVDQYKTFLQQIQDYPSQVGDDHLLSCWKAGQDSFDYFSNFRKMSFYKSPVEWVQQWIQSSSFGKRKSKKNKISFKDFLSKKKKQVLLFKKKK